MKAKKLLTEAEFIKFHYTNYKNNKNPKVKVLDFEYKGRKGQKTYGQTDDILGYNINYFKNKKKARKSIEEIDSFARMLSANKKEKYSRMKDFYPESVKHIRRYKKEHIKNLKYKDGWRWKKTDLNYLKKKDKNTVI